MPEIWKPIPGFETRYDISAQGRVRNHRTHRIISQQTNTKGYRLVSLYDPPTPTDNLRKTLAVARLVVAAFRGPIPPGMTVNHRNGIKDDNRLENLELMTNLDNVRHAKNVLGHRSGVKGSRQGNAKLTEADIPLIRAMHAEGKTARQIVEVFSHVSVQCIWHIFAGNTWTHV